MAGDCIFCRIADKSIPADLLFENETVVAFKDLHPQAPTHLLLIPRKHIARVTDLGAEDFAVVGEIHRAAQSLAQKLGLVEKGFRLVTNNGAEAGQTVPHLHYHLLAGRRLNWPPG